MPARLRRLSWGQWGFLIVLLVNGILIVTGLFFAPGTLLTFPGWGSLLGALGMQVALGAAALVGPGAFARFPQGIGISTVCGALFAALYLGVLIREFAGISDDYNLLLLFVSIGLLAGLLGAVVAPRWHVGVYTGAWALLIGTALWSSGVMMLNYVTWGSAQQYGFWQGDGAITEFHQQGGTNLSVFLLQDIQGALFYHPLLSLVVGAGCGAIASSIVLLGRWIQHRITRSSH